jgi:gamma-glutamyltranspeptidase/glutathione hydrolase
MPPPSSGTLAIGHMLGMLERAGLEQLPPLATAAGPEPRAEAVHLFREAGRLAYADRARYLTDPDFVPLPGGSATLLLDPQYLRGRSQLIGPRSMGRATPGVPLAPAMSAADDRSAERPSTSHVSVVDAQNHVVAMTTTIESGFGAQIMVLGFLLNNELTDFSFVPSEAGLPVANHVQGGKRPRSSMSPMLVFDKRSGALVMSLGSPGSSAIINYVAIVLVATLDWGLDAQRAIALPNFGSRNGPTRLDDGRVSAALVEGLRARSRSPADSADQRRASDRAARARRPADVVRRQRPTARGRGSRRLISRPRSVAPQRWVRRRPGVSPCLARLDGRSSRPSLGSTLRQVNSRRNSSTKVCHPMEEPSCVTAC